MSSESYQYYFILVIIQPYQKQIIFHMTFHMTLVISIEHMRIIFFWDFFPTTQISQNYFQRFDFGVLMFISL